MQKIYALITFLYISLQATIAFSSKAPQQIPSITSQQQRETKAQKDIDALFKSIKAELLNIPAILESKMLSHPGVHQIVVEGILYSHYILKGQDSFWAPIIIKKPKSLGEIITQDFKKLLTIQPGIKNKNFEKIAGTRRNRE